MAFHSRWWARGAVSLTILIANCFSARAAGGASRSISLSPTSISFGSVTVNAAGGTQTVAISNTGNAAVALSGISVTGDFTQTNNCGSSLSKSSQCTVSLVFKTTTPGSRTGTLTITDNAAGSPHIVALSGSGLAVPQLSFSSSNLSFGAQNVGSTSTPQTLSLSNSGTTSLAVNNIAISGDFTQTNTCAPTLAVRASCTISVTFKPTVGGTATGSISVTDNAPGSPHTVLLAGNGIVVTAGSSISGVWANEGGDKVTTDELRASNHTENLTGKVNNRAWDGTTISLSGARNEVLSFNLVLEAATSTASNVSVRFDSLTGDNGFSITGKPVTGDGVFDWTSRQIELFYTRYVEIKGLSFFGYFKGDERQIPVRFQAASHQWADRPDHNKLYPDALVPLELVNTFTIDAGTNQSVWADVYVPKSAPPGVYTGSVLVSEGGVVTRTIPVKLTVSPVVRKYSVGQSRGVESIG